MSVASKQASPQPAAMPEAASASVPSVTAQHPSPCPSWCREVHSAAASMPLQTTAHFSPQYQLANPQPLFGMSDVMLRSQLGQLDRQQDVGWARLCIAGASDVELNADEADIFIAQMQAFVDGLRVLRRQMG